MAENLRYFSSPTSIENLRDRLNAVRAGLADALDRLSAAEERARAFQPANYVEADLGRAAARIADALGDLSGIAQRGVGISSITGKGNRLCPCPALHDRAGRSGDPR